MKTIKIDITRCDVDNELSKITAYTGVKASPSASLDDFDRVATTDEDASLLNRYWANAANSLAEHYKGFVTTFSLDNEAISISMDLSNSFDCSLAGTVKEGMAAFVTAFMAKSWFALTFPDKAAEWDAEGRRILAEISRSVYHRRRPTRTTYDTTQKEHQNQKQ